MPRAPPVTMATRPSRLIQSWTFTIMPSAETQSGSRRERSACPASQRRSTTITPSCLLHGQTSRGAQRLCAPALLIERVEQHGEENHRALNELNPERLDIVKGQPIVDDPDQKHTQNRAEHGATTSEERCAADDDSGNRVQLQAGRGDRLSGVKPARQDDATQTRQS